MTEHKKNNELNPPPELITRFFDLQQQKLKFRLLPPFLVKITLIRPYQSYL